MADTTAPFEFLPLGAIIQSFVVGKTNIVQGFPTQELYQKYNAPYFGETIGRVANRISNGLLQNLNGRQYQLAQNNGPNALHGGPIGWGKRIWDGPNPVGVRSIPGIEGLEGGESVEFSLRSEDGEEGYPGSVVARVVYTTGIQKEEGKEVRVLGIEYEVKFAEEKGEVEETVVNVTNHSYFNLTGAPTIEGTQITLPSTTYLPVSPDGIPLSTTLSPYPSLSPSTPFTLGAIEPDIDDCFVTASPSFPSPSSVPIDTRNSHLTNIVSAYHPSSKIHLEVLTTEPAFQFYTGKYIDVPEIVYKDEEKGKEVKVEGRGQRSGFCVEPSRFVDAGNWKEWRGQAVLKRGEVYGSRVVYRGWSDE